MIKSKKDILIGLKRVENDDKITAHFGNKDKLLRANHTNYPANDYVEKPVHIYILSHNKPELGDWVYDNEFFLNSKMQESWESILTYKTDAIYYQIGKDERKIVATTDPKIYKDSDKVKQINNEELKQIIEKFNR